MLNDNKNNNNSIGKNITNSISIRYSDYNYVDNEASNS